MRDKKGFTLIEIMVAIAILGMGIVMVMQLFSGGLRSGRVSHDYTKALIYAKEKMEELLIDPVSGSGEFSEISTAGGNNRFLWDAEVSPESDTSAEQKTGETQLKLLRIKVKVFWNEADKQRSVELATLKAISERGE